MTRTDYGGRQTALSVLIAVLVVSAGCSSFLSDSNSRTPTEELTQQGTVTPDNTTANNRSTSIIIPTNGTDLRNISIPEDDTYRNTVYGEVDGGDSVLNGTNRYYEPVILNAEAGDRINVSMSSIAGDPELRLRTPNGSTVATDDDGGDGNNARFETLRLNQTGQYTLVTAAAEANTSIAYTLTIERYIEPNFQGPMSSWDEQSRYLEFLDDYALAAQALSGGNEGPSPATTAEEAEGNLSAVTVNYTVSAEEDYIIMEYAMDPNSTTYERIDIDAALQNSYWGLYETYVTADSAENVSWVPDRIYHIGYTYDGELYRTTYLDRDWAREYYENYQNDSSAAREVYSSLYFATLRFGPAHQDYTEGGTYSTTSDEVPVGTYENITIQLEAENESTAGT